MHVSIVPPASLLEPPPPHPPDVGSLITPSQSQYLHPTSSSSFITSSSSMLSGVGGAGSIMSVEDVLSRVPSELQEEVLRAEQFVQEGESVSRGAERLMKEAIGVHGGDRSQLTGADALGLQTLSALGFPSSAVGHELDTSSTK